MVRGLKAPDLAAWEEHRYKPRAPSSPMKLRRLSRLIPVKEDPMALERTFSILKPDATKRNLTGAINALIEKAGLRIVAQKRVKISRDEAEKFYAVHRERPFFREL